MMVLSMLEASSLQATWQLSKIKGGTITWPQLGFARSLPHAMGYHTWQNIIAVQVFQKQYLPTALAVGTWSL